MPGRLMVGQRTLDPSIGVRIPAGQHALLTSLHAFDSAVEVDYARRIPAGQHTFSLQKSPPSLRNVSTNGGCKENFQPNLKANDWLCNRDKNTSLGVFRHFDQEPSL